MHLLGGIAQCFIIVVVVLYYIVIVCPASYLRSLVIHFDTVAREYLVPRLKLASEQEKVINIRTEFSNAAFRSISRVRLYVHNCLSLIRSFYLGCLCSCCF